MSLRDRVQCDNGVYTTVFVGILECTQRLSGWNGGAHNCWSIVGSTLHLSYALMHAQPCYDQMMPKGKMYIIHLYTVCIIHVLKPYTTHVRLINFC